MRLRPASLFRKLGPGLITGAADDDPSGITTYTQTGAQFGSGLLWVNLYILPLVFAVQEIAARIGLVTGKGLVRNLRERYDPTLVGFLVVLLLIANTINLGADLGAIAAAIQLLVPANFSVILIASTFIIVMLEVFTSYKQYAKVLKWLTFSLFAYLLAGLFINANLGKELLETLVPRFSFDSLYLLGLVGIMGTTISPYLIFWQANEEVEEEMDHRLLSRKGGIPNVSASLIRRMRLDTVVGMTFSAITAWFIMVTAANTLFPNGIRVIETAAQAAEALEPLVQTFPNAGLFAKLLFAFGIIGTGLLAVPIFSASSSYALSELMGWKEGLNYKPKRAPAFYLVIVLSTVVGIGSNYLGINPMQALVYAAVLNGVAAAPLIAAIVPLANDRKLMGKFASPLWSNILGWVACLTMAVGSIAFIASLIA